MKHQRFGTATIYSAGYDPQQALLEIAFGRENQIWQYKEVPEDLWYRFKGEPEPDGFYHYYIKGCFAECRIESAGN